MSKKLTLKQEEKLHVSLVKQLLQLSTAGFGLVAALAWNDTIKVVIETYIKPYVPGSGISSQVLYAVFITLFAVLITYQLTKLSQRLEEQAKN